jgi:hypothetical protein
MGVGEIVLKKGTRLNFFMPSVTEGIVATILFYEPKQRLLLHFAHT